MAKINISKEIILSIANQDNSKFIENIDEKVNSLFVSAIEKMSNSISYVNSKNVYLQPVNELLTGAMIDNSVFEYLLGIENAQLELNTSKHNEFLKNLKDRFKFAWDSRRLFKKRRKKRRKKKEEDLKQEEMLNNIKFDPSKYDIYSLASDLQDTLVQFMDETSICYCNGNTLTLIGKDDFGANTQIIVHVVLYSNYFFKQFKNKRKGYIDIDMDTRYHYFNEKYNDVGENLIKILKIFNLIYFNVNKSFANQVFMESIVNFCPDELFEGKDMYDIFVKIINFLYYKPLKDVKSVNDPEKNVLNDEVCGNANVFSYKKMLDAIASKG